MPRRRLLVLCLLAGATAAPGQQFGPQTKGSRPGAGSYQPLGGQVPSDVPGWFKSIGAEEARQQFDAEGMKRLADMLKGRTPEQLEGLLKNREQFQKLLDANKDTIKRLMEDPAIQQKVEDYKKLEEFRKFLDRRPADPAPNTGNPSGVPDTPPVQMEPAPKGSDTPPKFDPKAQAGKIGEWLQKLDEQSKKSYDPSAKFDPEKWTPPLNEVPNVKPEEFPKPPQTEVGLDPSEELKAKIKAEAASLPKPGDPATTPNTEPSQPLGDPRAEQFDEWLKRNFGDSPAAREMAQSFGKLLEGKGFDGFKGSWLEGLNADFGRFNSWAGGNNWGNFNLSGLKGPSWNWNWNWGGSSPRINMPNMPSLGGGGGLSLGGGNLVGMIGLAVAIIGGLALLAYVLAKRQRELAPAAEGIPAEWLAALRQARTREELVKLFEALSFTRVGRQTRTWHHRLIAGEMARIDRQAADELAGLYEVARYTPPAQIMAAADFDRANRDAEALTRGGEATV